MTSNTIAELDVPLLGRYLESHVAGFHGLQSATKFSGGQSNPTFLLQADSGSYVLRRQPPGQLLRSAHAVDREFRVLQTLAPTEVPVARVWHLCEDPGVIGSMFYLMSYEQGDIFWDPALPDVPPAERAGYYREMIRILAAIHSVDVSRVGLADFGRPGNYFQRQLERWQQQYRAAETGNKPAMEQLMQWLQAHCPEDDGTVALVHGDFRLDNVIFHHGEARGQAVLDWELSTLGHPLADLAYFCMCLRLPPSQHGAGLGGLDRQGLGIPAESEIVAHYCKLRGIDTIEHWHFYLAFSFFRLASIVQGVYKRALAGNASNKNALEIGRLVDVLADMALGVIAQQEN
ncbi:phosphotransferase [Pseudomaricurvus sp. HS19]|uniref:phosphotransferase n=1 Tax=Pseudomaricurvus sp. HS19 TaxID=2692626 RepID=UPI0013682797|nr:phosphotransferase [Pseudomaricurvus sp. HS19]MYM64420.1 phosphotransferase [Pseudomaricurvus sp. HS19]